MKSIARRSDTQRKDQEPVEVDECEDIKQHKVYEESGNIIKNKDLKNKDNDSDKEHALLKSIFQPSRLESTFGSLEQQKNACIELLSELQTLLGSKYQTSILQIHDSIKECDKFDCLSTHLKNILALTAEFIKQDQSEKQEATIFIKKIVKNLFTLEKELTTSFETSSRDYEKDFLFGKNLKAEIINFTESVETLNTFDDLRSFINSNLDKLLTTFEDKIKEYNNRIEKSRNEHERIQENFKNLIVQIRERDKTIEEQSRVDPLTGIFNRRVFEDRIAIEFDRFHRYQKPFSLIFFDIDNFKDINDMCGHEAGDKVLKSIAERVGEMVRKPDVLARYGGEEFVVILPETDVIQGITVASKLRNGIEETIFEYDNDRVKVTISLGITEIKEIDKKYQSVINRADKYMYIAKKKGRNLVISDLDIPQINSNSVTYSSL